MAKKASLVLREVIPRSAIGPSLTETPQNPIFPVEKRHFWHQTESDARAGAVGRLKNDASFMHEKEASEAIPRPKAKLLVVEDDKGISGMLTQILRDEGYEVT